MENIINIVNFIRGCEPRRPVDLVQPVREQIRLMNENELPGTFLLMYDAMQREDILELLRPLDPGRYELGLWFEMCRAHNEAAGVPWHGRPGFDWDWHANAGFSVGYSREERRKLADAQVAKFVECFGYLPKSVGSWMIDAYTLEYLSDKYGIKACCICKDQWGTDGYTIWGGYWNQGYYPSRKNILCPAQTAENTIPVPVFRMLGSDPVTQYDLGLNIEDGAPEIQHVESLEPVYSNGGGNPKWIEWFMRQNFTGGSLAFAYAQAGQENSFGWLEMQKGLEYQFPLFARWRTEKGLRVERLKDTGEWFCKHFAMTPATSVCALEPYGERNAQSVWYDCRYYRLNIYRDGRGLRIRDIFLFDENYEERYLDARCETDYLVYDNLPVMDGNRMSGGGILAGAWLTDEKGEKIQCGDISADETVAGLTVYFDGKTVDIDETGLTLRNGCGLQFTWNRDRTALFDVSEDRLTYEFRGIRYALTVCGGKIKSAENLVILPTGDELRIEVHAL